MKGAIIVITGANRSNGIGLALVREFNNAGSISIGTYREESKSRALLDLTKKNNLIHALKLDVTSDDSVNLFKEKLESIVSRVDVLINNAGLSATPGTIATASIESLVTQMNTHAIGHVRVTQALLPLLRRANNPKVVNISSMLGSISSIGSGWTHYAPCKAASNALTLQMASTLKSEGVIVFAVHPGWVATDIGGHSAPVSPESSAKGIYNIINTSTMKDTATFRDYHGGKISW